MSGGSDDAIHRRHGPNPNDAVAACIDDYVGAESSVRAIEAFIDMLDLAALGFDVEPEATGRPGYHPAMMLKLYLYGYLNQVQSSRRLERECGRNLEVIRKRKSQTSRL